MTSGEDRRVCLTCPTILSRYNLSPYCAPCGKVQLDEVAATDPSGHDEGCCWDDVRDRCPGAGCGCRCHAAERTRILDRAHGRDAAVKPRRTGASALPRRGYAATVAYLEELRGRLVLRDGESPDANAVIRVIALLDREAEIK